MSVGVSLGGTPAIGIGTNMGMGTMPGVGLDPTAAVAGLGVVPGLGLGAPDVTATMGLGSAATAAAAPPIATECLLVSNLFDPAKSACLLFS